MNGEVKRAAMEWLKQKHDTLKAGVATPHASPARQTTKEAEDDRAAYELQQADLHREIAIVNAIYNQISGLP